eukprot:CAMPEP_0202898498 /NCGR_PEP_ID=MMETSP1392-20130828/7012_1 /ASSEMBLY_ACC=CAM_ASM_000868 /TAXON_ID=225041 /ORGANISM="Chlamydomonas chlamydogama, Strain SAG 11-48b" /LENGTH=1047 /DNA_ID=CAMNT_0049584449 /DNA_START=381 /DNA_END=3524 /DNA_ORIENTATION=+
MASIPNGAPSPSLWPPSPRVAPSPSSTPTSRSPRSTRDTSDPLEAPHDPLPQPPASGYPLIPTITAASPSTMVTFGMPEAGSTAGDTSGVRSHRTTADDVEGAVDQRPSLLPAAQHQAGANAGAGASSWVWNQGSAAASGSRSGRLHTSSAGGAVPAGGNTVGDSRGDAVVIDMSSPLKAGVPAAASAGGKPQAPARKLSASMGGSGSRSSKSATAAADKAVATAAGVGAGAATTKERPTFSIVAHAGGAGLLLPLSTSPTDPATAAAEANCSPDLGNHLRPDQQRSSGGGSSRRRSTAGGHSSSGGAGPERRGGTARPDPHAVDLPDTVRQRLRREYGSRRTQQLRSWNDLSAWLVPAGRGGYWALWTLCFTSIVLTAFFFMAGQYPAYLLTQLVQGSAKWLSVAKRIEAGPSTLTPWLEFWQRGGGDDNAVDSTTFNFDYLLLWGGRYGPALAGGEWWRWFSSILLHQNFNHLVSNMVLFLVLCGYLEHNYGTIRIFIIWLAAGVAGNFSSMVWEEPCDLVVGASGSVYGLIGLYLADILLNFESMSLPWLRVAAMVVALLFMVIMQVTDSALLHSTSHASHVGGALTGAFAALLFLPNIKDRRWRALKRLAKRLDVSHLLPAAPGQAAAGPAADTGSQRQQSRSSTSSRHRQQQQVPDVLSRVEGPKELGVPDLSLPLNDAAAAGAAAADPGAKGMYSSGTAGTSGTVDPGSTWSSPQGSLRGHAPDGGLMELYPSPPRGSEPLSSSFPNPDAPGGKGLGRAITHGSSAVTPQYGSSPVAASGSSSPKVPGSTAAAVANILGMAGEGDEVVQAAYAGMAGAAGTPATAPASPATLDGPSQQSPTVHRGPGPVAEALEVAEPVAEAQEVANPVAEGVETVNPLAVAAGAPAADGGLWPVSEERESRWSRWCALTCIDRPAPLLSRRDEPMPALVPSRSGPGCITVSAGAPGDAQGIATSRPRSTHSSSGGSSSLSQSAGGARQAAGAAGSVPARRPHQPRSWWSRYLLLWYLINLVGVVFLLLVLVVQPLYIYLHVFPDLKCDAK